MSSSTTITWPADLLTLRERFGAIEGLTLADVGAAEQAVG
ncbi:MAG: hypothetical protein V7607_4346 [Solirubrobacteraceae bacterium]